MKKGFTLAEVLITLAIIGVIAVLTVPGLVGNYSAKVAVTQLQNGYRQVKNAMAKAALETGVDTFLESGYVDDDAGFFRRYFEYSEICSSATDCNMAQSYKSPDGSVSAGIDDIIQTDLLASGGSATCMQSVSNYVVCKHEGKFLIDVNGDSKPNQIGRDLFWFESVADGRVKFRPTHDVSENHESVGSSENGAGTCAGAVVSAMDSACMSYVVKNGWKLQR